MRKYLVGVAAAAAGVALAMPATAQDDMSGISISGSMNNDFGFGSWVGGDPSADDFHMDIGATLTFTGTGTTDGGLTATAVVKLDADNGNIDEAYLTIAGGFGSINVGSDDNASNMHGNKGTGGGYGGLGYYDTGGYTPASIGGPPNGGGDALGIRYSTPSIGGFQAGVSFQPETGQTTATSAKNDSNMIAVGANFSGDFAGTSVTVGANHVSYKATKKVDDVVTLTGETLKEWGLGTSIGIGDTTLSLRYDTKPDSVANAVIGAKMGDATSLGVGIDHTIGALKFGIGYGTTTQENAAPDDQSHKIFSYTNSTKATDFALPVVASASVAAADAVDRKHTMLAVGASYDLGGGVVISAGISQGKATNMLAGDEVAFCVADADAVDAPDTGKGELKDADGDGIVDPNPDSKNRCPTDGYELATYTSLKDLDDVGVGLRIAFSF